MAVRSLVSVKLMNWRTLSRWEDLSLCCEDIESNMIICRFDWHTKGKQISNTEDENCLPFHITPLPPKTKLLEPTVLLCCYMLTPSQDPSGHGSNTMRNGNVYLKYELKVLLLKFNCKETHDVEIFEVKSIINCIGEKCGEGSVSHLINCSRGHLAPFLPAYEGRACIMISSAIILYSGKRLPLESDICAVSEPAMELPWLLCRFPALEGSTTRSSCIQF